MIQHEIVKRVFKYFGVPDSNGTFSILSKKNLVKKEFTVELEDGEKIQKNIWGIEGKIAESTIRAIATDITIDTELTEYILIFQLDDFSIYCLKLEKNGDNFTGKAFFAHDEVSWIELTDLLLAKMLVGIEQLNEVLVDYKPISDFDKLYKQLISFLNYEEATQIN